MGDWHSQKISEIFEQLDSEPQGLSEAKAGERIKRWGRNELQIKKPLPAIKLFFRQFANYFILVLLFAAGLAYGVSFAPGEADRRLTAYFILAIILLDELSIWSNRALLVSYRVAVGLQLLALYTH